MADVEVSVSALRDISHWDIPDAVVAQITQDIAQDPLGSGDAQSGPVRVRSFMGYDVVFAVSQ